MKSIVANNWCFQFNKSTIASSVELDKISGEYEFDKIPDSFFSKNFLYAFINDKQFEIMINPILALKFSKKSFLNENFKKNSNDINNYIGYILQDCKVSLNCNEPVNTGNIEIENNDVDWTYTSYFKGEISFNNNNYKLCEPKNNEIIEIPKNRLLPDNKILNYEDIFLYEDDLGDFGYSQMRVRFRTMKDCAFILLRSYIRIDNVLIRLIDTRYFIDTIDNYIIRDYTIKEENYSNLRQKGAPLSGGFIINENQSDIIYNYLTEIYKETLKFVPHNT